MAPYLNTDAMADSVVRFLNHPELCQTVGASLGNKVRADYTVAKAGGQIISLIDTVMNDARIKKGKT
jgi:glycosyltransferase involved in cell wall biosynthesis